MVYLHVISYNQAAQRFYTRMGFTQCAVLREFYTIRWATTALALGIPRHRLWQLWGGWLRGGG